MQPEAVLQEFTKKLDKARALRRGAIVLRLSGEGGEDFVLACSERGTTLERGAPPSAPLIEVIGDAQRIAAVLEGSKDAAAEFLAGGFRIRGDIRYIRELATELGFRQEPF